MLNLSKVSTETLTEVRAILNKEMVEGSLIVGIGEALKKIYPNKTAHQHSAYVNRRLSKMGIEQMAGVMVGEVYLELVNRAKVDSKENKDS